MNLSNKDIYLQYALSQFLPIWGGWEGFLFNAYNSMKAYSYNGERYGYYGYDASGERTYKYDIFTAGSWTNQTGGMDVSLQIDKMMLYPNGYLNMNQNGEYTKHYYADALRIASKIGNGFSQNLCYEANQIGDDIDPNYLEDRRDKQYDEMMEELTELINGNQITDINPIPYPEANLCNLSGSGIETALFFYHPDHLGSTGMVTDNISNYTQGMLYAPFGEIICDYNPTFHDSPMPNYAFNAKELDEENNMYYYSARYYAPPTFISRDPMFEKYPSISPYTYCANNPLKYVDPTGEKVVITGDAAEEAVGSLSTKNITIKMTDKGELYLESGKARTISERKLVRAIKSEKVTVNVTATNKTDVIGQEGDIPIVSSGGGSFGGNCITEDGKHAEANQFINPKMLAENFGKGALRRAIGHEITEAFIGGVIAIRRGVPAPVSHGNYTDKSIYNKAHRRAIMQPYINNHSSSSSSQQENQADSYYKILLEASKDIYIKNK